MAWRADCSRARKRPPTTIAVIPAQRTFYATLAVRASASRPRSTSRSRSRPSFRSAENGCAGARVLDHLERHGDYGRIDPEALLYVTRLEHERRLLESARGSAAKRSPATSGRRSDRRTARAAPSPSRFIRACRHRHHRRRRRRRVEDDQRRRDLDAAHRDASRISPSARSPTRRPTPTASTSARAKAATPRDFIPGIGLLVSDDGGTTWNLPASVLAVDVLSDHRASDECERASSSARTAARCARLAGANGPWTTVIAVDSRPQRGIRRRHRHRARSVERAVLYAATWDRNRWCVGTTARPRGNFASPTVLKSTDGGATWTPAAGGLPGLDADGARRAHLASPSLRRARTRCTR